MLKTLTFFKGHHARYMFVSVALVFVPIFANSQVVGINGAATKISMAMIRIAINKKIYIYKS
jgi:hypothetical protein